MGRTNAPKPPSGDEFELRATIDGRAVVFPHLELWWAEAEPPEQDHPTFTLATSADLGGDGPRIEVECVARDATTFRDIAGRRFVLAPLSAEGGGWVTVDFGRDFRARGFPARDWVARRAIVRFDDGIGEVLSGSFEADLERSAAKGGPPGPAAPIRLEGSFRARAPRW